MQKLEYEGFKPPKERPIDVEVLDLRNQEGKTFKQKVYHWSVFLDFLRVTFVYSIKGEWGS